MSSKNIYLILFLFVIVSSMLVGYSDSQKTRNLSEEEYIETTLTQLGYPAAARAGALFNPVAGGIYLPIKNFYRNQNVNPFGIYRTSRFVGYHSGVDIEIDPDDLAKDVPVYSIYNGEVLKVETASGYGGVVIIRHNFEGNNNLAGVYGHLRLRDIKVKPGQRITSGYLIGYLGAAYSSETGAERKHLHFGLYKNRDVDIRGYVDSQRELEDWFNPNGFMREAGAKEVD
ncbi:MAG: M23 family metallopeptidase [Patescibacteria group bacterium]